MPVAMIAVRMATLGMAAGVASSHGEGLTRMGRGREVPEHKVRG
jgi:hypothetical protein